MGARDDVPDGAQDRDGAGERLPQSPGPRKTPDPSQAPGLEGAPDGPAEVPDPAELPDLLDLDLAELRTVQHPVLAEMLAELRTRSGQPSEILWGFNSAF
ncbi:FxSxx-COOH cyclophane-containing RiPP peptide [Streptomyces sp. NBC_00328]|uniref:FxSxx-COOH cyclophane-containing RiPP peptide n=1 Tax=Streptomyces sp. NBC_00328 TaxID=2903646 RepID=UPI002E2C5BD8|nr:FxSxx-COOH cyclophane-containing RiPP peptide [Streptomyces sp. NBC_00328]